MHFLVVVNTQSRGQTHNPETRSVDRRVQFRSIYFRSDNRFLYSLFIITISFISNQLNMWYSVHTCIHVYVGFMCSIFTFLLFICTPMLIT
jgi:hypothetical protein